MIARDQRLVEPAGALHATALAAIHRRAFSDEDSWNASLMAAQLGRPGVFALISGASGMIMVRVAADEAEILTVGVVPEARQQGIGTAPAPRRRRGSPLQRRRKTLPGSLHQKPRRPRPLPGPGLHQRGPPAKVLR